MVTLDKRKGSVFVKKILCIAFAVFLILWMGSLARCEMLTKEYYDDFKTGHLQTGFHDELEYFKVLSCDGETAEVYYIAKDHANGCVLDFEMQEGVWSMTEWNCIWSDHGSASDAIWPYWWHFIYGGF